MVDGFIDGGSSHPNWRSLIDGRVQYVSPLKIEVTAQYQSEATIARATAIIRNESNQTITGRLHFVLTETGIYWIAPNGSTVHNQTMLDMIPNELGEVITIPAYDSLTRQHNFVIRDTTWLNPPSNTLAHLTVLESCQVVVFVQDPSTNEVYQAGKAWLRPGLEIDEESKVRLSSSLSLKAFPNPFVRTIKITSPIPELRIYDACGNLVKAFYRTNVNWDSRTNRPGVYFVESGNSQIKILKVR